MALALLVLDGVLLLASLVTAGGGNVGAGAVVRVLLGIAIYRGATGARQLRAAQRTAQAAQPFGLQPLA